MHRRAFLGSLIGAGIVGANHPAAASLTAPPRAASAGFTNLIFDEEFDGTLDIGFGTEGHKWNAGLWWEPVPSLTAFTVKNSVLTMNAAGLPELDLCTQWHDHLGGTQFLGGYFEARLRCYDWSSFWLFCWDRPTVWSTKVLLSDPLTWTNEIDIAETGGGHPNSVWCTLHKNSSGDTLPDQQNYPAEFDLNTAVIGHWHTYGLLWTQAALTWFVDEIPLLVLAPYASTWQPVQLLLSVAPGGVDGSASTTPDPILQADWVRVWH